MHLSFRICLCLVLCEVISAVILLPAVKGLAGSPPVLLSSKQTPSHLKWLSQTFNLHQRGSVRAAGPPFCRKTGSVPPPPPLRPQPSSNPPRSFQNPCCSPGSPSSFPFQVTPYAGAPQSRSRALAKSLGERVQMPHP